MMVKKFAIKLQCSTEGGRGGRGLFVQSNYREVLKFERRGFEKSRARVNRDSAVLVIHPLNISKSAQDGQTNKTLFLYFIGAASLLFVRSGVRDNVFLAHV